jgi:hypothetical protein
MGCFGVLGCSYGLFLGFYGLLGFFLCSYGLLLGVLGVFWCSYGFLRVSGDSGDFAKTPADTYWHMDYGQEVDKFQNESIKILASKDRPLNPSFTSSNKSTAASGVWRSLRRKKTNFTNIKRHLQRAFTCFCATISLFKD